MQTRNLSLILAAAAGSFLLAFALPALGDGFSDPEGVPRLVPFHGYLEDAGGAVTSEVTASFEIYDAATGGTKLWGPEAHTFTPAAGRFNVMLGGTSSLSEGLLDGGDAYVAVTVEGTLLSGRQRLGSAPYALRAATAHEAETAVNFVASGGVSAASVTAGVVDATSTGVRFPDDSVQTTRARLSCTYVTATTYAAGGQATAVASLPAGLTRTGGGCHSDSVHRKVLQTYPSGGAAGQTWTCVTQDHSYSAAGSATAYVIGCQIPN